MTTDQTPLTLASVGGATPVHGSGSGYWWKREDLAGYTTAGAPSGAKVRQYAAMIEAAPPDAVLMVGCAADSAMQVYLAHAAQTYDRPAVAVVPHRKTLSESSAWAQAHGCHLVTVSPGYPSQYRKKMREMAAEAGVPVVRWDRRLALADTAGQVIASLTAEPLVTGGAVPARFPDDLRRVVVPSGSGLTAAGVLAGLAHLGHTHVEVVAVAVSDMATEDGIRDTAAMAGIDSTAVPLTLHRSRLPYGRRNPLSHVLPDGTPLDAYYAAKAVDHVRPGDLFWVSGRRPF